MNDFFRKIKIIQPFSIILDITKQKFVSELSKVTENSDLGMFSIVFEAFDSDNKEFIGKVSQTGFKIRRKIKMFDTKNTVAIAEGTFKESDNKLLIEGTINGFNNFFYFIYGIIIISFVLFIITFSFNQENSTFILNYILFQGLIMFIIPYFVIRRSVNRLKYELEREFFYLTK